MLGLFSAGIAKSTMKSQGVHIEIGTKLSMNPIQPGSTGTPFVFEENHFAYFGAFPPDLLNSDFSRRLFIEPQAVRELDNAFLLFVFKGNSYRVFGDRLGVQAIFYAQPAIGKICVSTHLGMLLKSLGHNGAVNTDGLFTHLSFGYGVRPYTEIYAGIRRLPPASYLSVENGIPTIVSYDKPINKTKLDIPVLISALATNVKGCFLGTTAGKDSLALSCITERPTLTGTFGRHGSSDRLQGRAVSRSLGFVHRETGLCSVNSFLSEAEHIAFHSGGLATTSYVDMLNFIRRKIPKSDTFIMGEGGECIRDFFGSNTDSPLDKLTNAYMTPKSYIEKTLAKSLRQEYESFSRTLFNKVREFYSAFDDEQFFTEFYRGERMPGNFSLRHSIISPLRSKHSPFLNAKFVESTYGIDSRYFKKSGLHRRIIEATRPDLLHFFDSPINSPISVQDWEHRFQGKIGAVVLNLLRESLAFAEDIFDQQDTIRLTEEVIKKPSRAIYYLFRVLSFCLFRRKLSTGY